MRNQRSSTETLTCRPTAIILIRELLDIILRQQRATPTIAASNSLLSSIPGPATEQRRRWRLEKGEKGGRWGRLEQRRRWRLVADPREMDVGYRVTGRTRYSISCILKEIMSVRDIMSRVPNAYQTRDMVSRMDTVSYPGSNSPNQTGPYFALSISMENFSLFWFRSLSHQHILLQLHHISIFSSPPTSSWSFPFLSTFPSLLSQVKNLKLFRMLDFVPLSSPPFYLNAHFPLVSRFNFTQRFVISSLSTSPFSFYRLQKLLLGSWTLRRNLYIHE